MKEFFRLMRRYIPPYKKSLGWAVFFNLLSAVLNVFSFSLLIPILQILFEMETRVYAFMPWGSGEVKDVVVNNFYYYVQTLIEQQGASLTLLILFCH